MSRPLVIALGNTFRGDDAVGPTVLRTLSNESFDPTDLVEITTDPLELLELWAGRHTIIVDAARSGAIPGSILEFDALNGRLPTTRFASSHAIDLLGIIELSRALKRIPKSLWLIAIEAAGFTQGAPMSFAVRQSVANAADRVRARLLLLQSSAPIRTM